MAGNELAAVDTHSADLVVSQPNPSVGRSRSSQLELVTSLTSIYYLMLLLFII